MQETKICPFCAEEIKVEAIKCKHCGSLINGSQEVLNPNEGKHYKSKNTAGILAIFLGGLGVHKFYLGYPIQGILYLVFMWTFIPAILGLLEGFSYFSYKNDAWNTKYNSNDLNYANTSIKNNSEQNSLGFDNELRIFGDKSKSINIGSPKNIIITIIVLFLLYNIMQWVISVLVL